MRTIQGQSSPPTHSAELQAGGDLGPQKAEFYNETEGSSLRQELPPKATCGCRTGGLGRSFESCLWSAHLSKSCSECRHADVASHNRLSEAAPPPGKVSLVARMSIQPSEGAGAMLRDSLPRHRPQPPTTLTIPRAAFLCPGILKFIFQKKFMGWAVLRSYERKTGDAKCITGIQHHPEERYEVTARQCADRNRQLPSLPWPPQQIFTDNQPQGPEEACLYKNPALNSSLNHPH